MKRTLQTQLLMLLCLLTSTFAYAQQNGTIKGKVLTSDGNPAAFISIVLSGTNQGAITNNKGEYKINNVKQGSYTLRATAVGASQQEESVTVKTGETVTANFSISYNSAELDVVNIRAGHTNKFVVKKTDASAKMPLGHLENPQNISVISGNLLAEQQIFKVDDALKNAPGIQKMWEAVGRAGIGGAIYNLRGFVTNVKARNGISGNVASTIDAANIERIEVLKGPSGTLFGNAITSYGGLINRVMKTPYDSVGGRVDYSAGSYGLNRLSADVNTPLNADKTVLLRINTAYTTQSSFRDAGFSKTFVFAPSISYRASDKLTLNVDAEILAGKANDFMGVFFYGNTVANLGTDRIDKINIDYKKAFISNSLYNTSQNVNVYGGMNYQINDEWKLQTNVSVSNSFSDGRTPYFYLLPNAALGIATPGANNLARMVWSPNGSDNAIEVQPLLQGDFKIGSMRNRLTVGLDYFKYKSNISYERFVNNFGATPTTDFFDIVPAFGPAPGYNNFTEDKVSTLYGTKPSSPYEPKSNTNTYSAFVFDALNITDELIALAGVRIDRFFNKGIYSAITNTTSPGYAQTAYSPKFGLVYQIVKDQVSLFGNYQNGFTNKTGVDFEGKTFKPEQANQIEGGVKLDAFSGKLAATLSYYDITVKDIVRPYGAANMSIQDGTQVSKGFEAELMANPVNGLNIIFGYAYNESKYEKIDADGTSGGLNGLRPTTAGPVHAANLYLSYRVPFGLVEGLGISVGGNYAGKNYLINSVAAGKIYAPAYTVVNSSLFYDVNKFRITFSANNIGNEKYWTGYSTFNSQMPRNFIIGAGFKF
ncbi:TonB-dependent receptor [Pedobacter frigoris]|uniref:TonB-dependent receptor n=1 Tax=Pedobacter frigoris TaxID=2571272 RepID=UPI00292E4CCF|nr:TonB-dependent receptor [Pedobacter frigoris]